MAAALTSGVHMRRLWIPKQTALHSELDAPGLRHVQASFVSESCLAVAPRFRLLPFDLDALPRP